MANQSNKRILVIDDQASIREDFEKILGTGADAPVAATDARSAFLGRSNPAPIASSFELSTAGQGQQGVDLVRASLAEHNPFALAFVDVRMPPGMDGLETVKALWALDDRLQVVICTAYSDYSFDDIVREVGSSDRLLILKKPFDPVEVRQMAGALTEKWNIQRLLECQMEELREANVRAESANRAKTDFLANMSHEIRTPMNALLGYVDLMCDPTAKLDERQVYGRTVRKSGEHLLTILNDLLDVSRIEASRMVINSADFNPFELVHEAACLMRSEAGAANLEIDFEVQGEIPMVVESDLVRVRQILINLIGNAIKFTSKGEIRVVLRLDENYQSNHRYLCVDVIDTGAGIESEMLESIFEPFQQADTSSTRVHGGTGMGLTISKNLANLLGGRLSASSELGIGSCFTLQLYAGELGRAYLRSYSPADCSLDVLPQGLKEHVAELEDVLLEGRVLVVEDVKLNRVLLSAMLRRSGAAVEMACDGQEGSDMALERQREGQPFDLVLMDMQMPVMDGYDATRRLRAEGYGHPVVALTAHAMAGDREKCLEAGCDDYATKPLDKVALLRICREQISLGRSGAALPSSRGAVESEAPSSLESH